MNECCNVLNTLVEKMEIMECVECPILKLEIETLKGQLTHATSLSCTCSSSSSETWKILKKNSHVTKRNRRRISSKAICHYYGNKGHIIPLCHVRNVRSPNGKMTWIPKCTSTKPKGPN